MIKFDVSLKIFLIVSMIFYWVNKMAYEPQMIFFQYGVISLFGVSLMCSGRRKIKNEFLGAVFLYCLVHTVLFHFTVPARQAFLNLFLGVLAIKVIGENMSLDYKKYGILFICFAVLNIIWMILQKNNADPIFSNVPQADVHWIDTVGFMNARYALGCVGVLMLPYVYSVSPLACIVLLPLLIVGKSSSVILAGTISFLILTWFRSRLMFYVSLGILLACSLLYVFYYDMPSGQWDKRLAVWHYSANMLKDQIWFGFGLSGWFESKFMGVQDNGQPEWWRWAHNDIYQFIYELGMIGAVFLYGYVKGIFKGFLNISFLRANVVPMCAFLSLFIISLFHMPFHLGRLSGIGVFILGNVEALNADKA